jgi:hypothetical protein
MQLIRLKGINTFRKFINEIDLRAYEKLKSS